jgi:hypothetical protein
VTTYFLYALWKIIWHYFEIFGRKYLEIFWKFSSFLVQKVIFQKSLAKNIVNATFYFFQICPFFFFALVHTINHNFCNETTVWAKSVESLVNKNKQKFILLELAKFLSRPVHRIQFISFISWKKYFFRCAKISFFFGNFRFWRRNRMKTNKLNSVDRTVFSVTN